MTTRESATKPATVYLVGAGPGDPGLLTVRGRELLMRADAVLHDELVHPALLALVRPDCVVRYVGKRGHHPSDKRSKQREIEAALIDAAQSATVVVRLKGGDPFLFGRGSEECEALARAGIPFEIVPGVTSPLAAAAYAGISLTHRDFATSVTFLSATRRDGEGFDYARLRGLGGTLVVLMGHKQVERVATGLMNDAELPGDTPVACISNGTLPTQHTLSSTLERLAEDVAADPRLYPPALFVVGKVASLRQSIRWYDVLPLFGKRVLVPRADEQAADICAELRARGADPLALPLFEIQPAKDAARIGQAVSDLGSYDVVVFTSPNGVERFFQFLAAAGKDARAFASAQIAAVGSTTADALASRGLRCDIVPADFRGESLAKAILAALGDLNGKRVLIPRAQLAREVLPETLRAAGVSVDVVGVYQNQPVGDVARARLRELLTKREVDAILLTSGSMVKTLVQLLNGQDTEDQQPLSPEATALLDAVCVASIGPVTSDAARALGLSLSVQAQASTQDALLAALEAFFSVPQKA